MVTVALIGADGAGKTTIGLRLEEAPDLSVRYLYMGVNPHASRHLLPTTRIALGLKRLAGKEVQAGGPPDPRQRKPEARGLLRRSLRAIRNSLRTANLLAEEWYRQGLAWYHQARGRVVVFDRHFYSDYYAHDVNGTNARHSLSRRVHGFMLKRVYPQPGLVILLDAPAEVLFGRKGEGSVELIERRRQEYFQLRDQVRNFLVVDVDRPLDAVTEDVREAIRCFQRTGEVVPS